MQVTINSNKSNVKLTDQQILHYFDLVKELKKRPTRVTPMMWAAYNGLKDKKIVSVGNYKALDDKYTIEGALANKDNNIYPYVYVTDEQKEKMERAERDLKKLPEWEKFLNEVYNVWDAVKRGRMSRSDGISEIRKIKIRFAVFKVKSGLTRNACDLPEPIKWTWVQIEGIMNARLAEWSQPEKPGKAGISQINNRISR